MFEIKSLQLYVHSHGKKIKIKLKLLLRGTRHIYLIGRNLRG